MLSPLLALGRSLGRPPLPRSPPLPRCTPLLRSFFDTGLSPLADQAILPISESALAKYQVSTDETLGGLSSARVSVLTDASLERPFLRFEGRTCTKLPPPPARPSPSAPLVSRVGYASFLSPPLLPPFSSSLSLSPVLALHDHDTLCVTLRVVPSRRVTLNVHVDAYIPHECYQGYVMPLPSEGEGWQRISMRFEDMVLTSHGQEKETQRSFDKPEVKAFGLTVADGTDGDFRVDVLEVVARCNDDRF